MINQPPVDLLLKQLSLDGREVSRYCLCVVAAKRARQILELRESMASYNSSANQYNSNSSSETAKRKTEENVLAVASQEIAQGKIKCIKD